MTQTQFLLSKSIGHKATVTGAIIYCTSFSEPKNTGLGKHGSLNSALKEG